MMMSKLRLQLATQAYEVKRGEDYKHNFLVILMPIILRYFLFAKLVDFYALFLM